MMKKLFFSVFLLLMMAIGAMAQTTLFSEDFEGGAMPDGWTTEGPGSWSVGSGDYSSTTGAGQGTYNALITHSDRDNVTKLISPEIDLSSVTSATLSFMHIERSWTGDIDELRVYYRASSGDSWAQIAEYTSAYASWTTEEDLVLPNTSSTYQLAFEMTDNYGYGVGIDNIQIFTPPSCPLISSLTASSITNSSAYISWTETGSATAWVLKYGFAGFDVETEGITQNISTTPAFEITGLTANTAYDVYVKAVCGGGDESAWRNISFRTTCGAITSFPWSENFESYESGNFTEPCWVNEHISGSGSQIFRIYTYSNGTNSTKQLQLPDMSSGTMTKLMLPEFNFGGVAHQFVLDVYRVSATSYAGEGIRVFASEDGDIEGATELAFISRNYGTSDDAHGIPAESASGWFTYELNIPLTGTCYIILRGESKYGSSTYMDNFIVREVPTCIKPTALAASGITSTSATLDWSAGASETAWVLKYGPAGFDVESEGTSQNISTTPTFEITGLAANTAYDVYVKANCGGGDESEWIQTSFRTECGIESIPWSENFDSQSAGAVPTCWTKVGSGSVLVNNGNANSGSNSLRFSGVTGGNIIALPQFGSEISGLQLSFYTRPENTTNSSCGTFEVGYITDLTDASTFVPVESYAYNDWASATHTQKDVVMSSAPAGSYFAFNHKANATYYYWFVDDVSVDLAPSCVKPISLAVSNITSHTATLTWTAGADETAWQISLNDDEDDLINVTEPTYTLTGLAPESDYTVKVRAKCSESDYSEWTANVAFTTAIACPAPTALVYTDVTNVSATVSWTPGASESLWNFMYKAATAEEWTEVNGLTDPTYTITGLTGATSYNVKVQADCESEGTSGIWLQGSFSTAYGIPFVEEFATSTMPANWLQRSGLLENVMGGAALTSGTGWYFGSNNGVFDSHARINIYGSTRYYWLLTPTIVMDANVQLTFDLALTAYSGTGAASGTCDDDKFVVLISTDNGATWTILRQYDNAGSEYVYNNIPTAGEGVDIDLTSYSTDNVIIAFYGESTVGSNGDNNLHIDNVRLDYIPVTTYTITATAGENGTITPAEATVNEGADQEFTITPAAGYQIASVMVDTDNDVTATVVANNGVYTFTNVTADHTIAATFEVIPATTYTITATAGENGTITPAEAIVDEGADQAFTITPAAGYQIASVMVDTDNDVTDELEYNDGVYTYTFENVVANHTIHATFELLQTYTITVNITGNGEVVATDEDDNVYPMENGVVTVNNGADVYLEITPAENYQIESVTIDGVPEELEQEDLAGYSYSFFVVEQNHIIDVTFVPADAVDMIDAASMAIYPNPNNGMFSIDFSNIEGDATYEIIDVRGAVVETRSINVMNGATMNFNHNLDAGTYFVRIISGDKVYVEQIVVE